MTDHSVAEQVVAEAELEQVTNVVYKALAEYTDVQGFEEPTFEVNYIEYFNDTALHLETSIGSFILTLERE